MPKITSIDQLNLTWQLKERVELYEATGVQKHWIIAPVHEWGSVYKLNTEGTYVTSKILVDDELVLSEVLASLQLEVKSIFEA